MAEASNVVSKKSLAGYDSEIHFIVWDDGSDVSDELSTNLSEIHAAIMVPCFGANAGHTDADTGVLELDETVSDTTGVITVSSGAVTINRLKTDAAGTLAAQRSLVILFGKS